MKNNLKVTLTSSDPNVVNVVGSHESVISAGKSETIFWCQALKLGTSYLKLSAEHFVQSTRSDWILQDLIGDREAIQVWGRFSISPESKILKIGEYFDLQVILDPMPDREVRVDLESAYNCVDVPDYITIPAGSKSGKVKIKARREGTDKVCPKLEHYLGKGGPYNCCTILIEPQPQPTPPSTTYKNLPQKICANYEDRNDLGKVSGTIIKIQNPTNYNLKIFRWVGNAPPGEPPIQLHLKPHEVTNINLKTKDVANGWGAAIEDDIQCINAPPFVTLIITYTIGS